MTFEEELQKIKREDFEIEEQYNSAKHEVCMKESITSMQVLKNKSHEKNCGCGTPSGCSIHCVACGDGTFFGNETQAQHYLRLHQQVLFPKEHINCLDKQRVLKALQKYGVEPVLTNDPLVGEQLRKQYTNLLKELGL